MRISDWSSDVCSSDLFCVCQDMYQRFLHSGQTCVEWVYDAPFATFAAGPTSLFRFTDSTGCKYISAHRSEERRVGKECVSTCRSRWSPDHEKKKTTHNKLHHTYTISKNHKHQN